MKRIIKDLAVISIFVAAFLVGILFLASAATKADWVLEGRYCDPLVYHERNTVPPAMARSYAQSISANDDEVRIVDRSYKADTATRPDKV
ncbi:hypothetical protein [Thioalkalivibrio sp. HK1]|uniref:hypothetical protein n=1 Tax=Thioalkalivibrio sp. HK1 TaxID=1469245 RepID=UPI0012DFD806|nr:hypothetical protein [Thioalkalivibrio sp. HK1]